MSALFGALDVVSALRLRMIDSTEEQNLRNSCVCPVCMEMFTDEPAEKVPKKFGCGNHHVCKECLGHLISHSNARVGVKCPVCRAPDMRRNVHQYVTDDEKLQMSKIMLERTQGDTGGAPQIGAAGGAGQVSGSAGRANEGAFVSVGTGGGRVCRDCELLPDQNSFTYVVIDNSGSMKYFEDGKVFLTEDDKSSLESHMNHRRSDSRVVDPPIFDFKFDRIIHGDEGEFLILFLVVTSKDHVDVVDKY